MTGAVQWTFFSGMEAGLFTIAVLATLDAYLAWRGSTQPHALHHPALWMGVAALIRPEGLVMSGILWLLVVTHGWYGRRASRRSPQRQMGPREILFTSLAAIAGAWPFLLNLLLTGSPIATGAQAKSWFGNVPFRPWDIAGSVLHDFTRILERFTAGLLAREPWYVSPGILLLAVAGWAKLWRRGHQRVLALSAGWFVLNTLYTATLITAIWHVGRYRVPFLALIIPFAALGVAALPGTLPRRWQTVGFASLATGLLATALISTAQARSLYRDAVRTLAGSGDRVYQADMLRFTAGLRLLDRLDFADLEDEARHRLTFWERATHPGFPTEVKQLRYRAEPSIEVLDGGRLANGGLRFQVAAQAGQALVFVARLHATAAGAVRVTVDGRDLGLWRYPALPGEWLETAFVVPAAAVTRDSVAVRLEVVAGGPASDPFAPYHLWVFGGQPVALAPTPGQTLHARLGEAVELVGYDLALPGAAGQAGDGATTPAPFRPGDAVHVVLYWRAVRTPDEDAKAFVHLYDESGEIASQQD